MRRLIVLTVTLSSAIGCASAPVGKMAWVLEREPEPAATATSSATATVEAGREGDPSALSVASPEAARSRRAAAGYTDAELLAFEPDEPYLPPVANPAPEKLAAEAPVGPPIDAALLRFAADARLRRAVLPHSRRFPPDAVAAWQGLARELEQYLERPMPQTPLAELVRSLFRKRPEEDTFRCYTMEHNQVESAPNQYACLTASWSSGQIQRTFDIPNRLFLLWVRGEA